MPSLSLPEPPQLDFATWIQQEAGVTGAVAAEDKGMHVLFSGPTQSGKTTLCRIVASLRDFVVVLGSKPRDSSLDAYVRDGYVRIDHWPPTRRDIRKCRGPGCHFIVWPNMKTRADLRKHTGLYATVLDSVYTEGLWTVVVDEGLWMCDPKGLGLGAVVSDIAYGSASNGVSLYLLVQRPANVPPITWTSVGQAILWHMGRTDDVREMASLGIYDPRAAVKAVQNLHGHQFLDLPTRAQAEWAVSEVPPAWAR